MAGLGAESGELRTLVVTAGGFEQEIVNAPASITVVTREELERQRVRNLADALRDLEGVDVDGLDARSNKTGNRSISLRGLPSEYTLVLIDGRRQNVAGTVAPNAFGDAASVFLPPVAAIDRIEVIRGPMSTLYGADALGGVVNIITRKPGDEWSGSAILDSTFPSDSAFGATTGFELYGAGPIVSETLSAQLYGRLMDRAESRIEFPGQDTSLDRRRTMGQNPVAADVQTAGGKLLFTPDARNEIYLGADYTDQTYNNDRGQMGSIRPGDGYSPELGFEREQYYLGYTGRFDLGLWETTLTHNITRTTGRTIPNAAASAASGRRGTDRTLESENTVLDSKFLSPIGAHMLTLGVQYWEADLTDGIPDTTFRNSQWGIYVEDEWTITDTLALTGGLRYDDHDAFGGRVTPRAYAVWNATDEFTLKGGVGQGYKAPFLEQLYDGVVGFGNQGQDPLFGNPNLEPETSTNYEISGIFNSTIGLFAQLTFFYTEISDKIERPTAASGVTDEFANIGEARVQGLEFVASYQIARDWVIGGNYTYTDSEVTTSDVAGINRGDPLFGVPEHALNARLTWQATPKISTYLASEYRSSRYRPDSFHEPHLGGSAQGASEALGSFKGYNVFNLGGSYDFTDKISINAVIYNLENRNFNDYRPYPLRNDPDVIAYSNVYNNIYEPRQLWVSLNVGF
jgi:outer membrane receptor for ferrienterochelin and colicins